MASFCSLFVDDLLQSYYLLAGDLNVTPGMSFALAWSRPFAVLTFCPADQSPYVALVNSNAVADMWTYMWVRRLGLSPSA